jgi:hypothetical protein
VLSIAITFLREAFVNPLSETGEEKDLKPTSQLVQMNERSALLFKLRSKFTSFLSSAEKNRCSSELPSDEYERKAGTNYLALTPIDR